MMVKNMKMKISNILSVFFILVILEVCDSYRILGIYALSVRSHFNVMNELFKGLIDKGHKVDVINAISHQEPNPNYTQIIKLPDLFPTHNRKVSYQDAKLIVNDFVSIAKFGYKLCENVGYSEFLNLAYNPPKDPPYDIIIAQMMNHHCFTILGYLWNIPVVLVSTSSLYPWMHDMIGNSENIAFSSNNINLIKQGKWTSFWKRFHNAYVFYGYKLGYMYWSLNQDELLKKYFGPNVPSIRELEKNISLVLTNSHFSIDGAKPMMTGIIEIGGLHINNESLEFTEDLKKWLNESKDGVIYFSFGSIIQIETLPKEVITVMFKSLKNIAPIRVLIRIINPKLLPIEIPDNFYIFSWIPQKKVLQHQNIKAFITHGGLLGTQESIYYGIPMLCIPILADQFTNAINYVEHKIGIMINIETITQQKFDYAVYEILNNSMYRNNIKKLSRLFKDRPQSAKDTAVFWIEYVIRNGKDSLRSAVMDLTWWQIALLDILAFIFSVLFIILFITVYIFKKLRLFFYKNNINLKKNI